MTTISLSTGVEVNNVDDGGYAAFNRNATKAKLSGDMLGAVTLLRQAKAAAGDQYQDTRLAKFLQEAGFFEEAMAEIQWLLDTNQQRLSATMTSPQISQSHRQAIHARWCGSFHRAAALICKRQGIPEQRKHHEDIADKYFSIWERLDPIGEAESEALRARHRISIEAARKAAIQQIKDTRRNP